jgi:AcrR family transcriptional regulator
MPRSSIPDIPALPANGRSRRSISAVPKTPSPAVSTRSGAINVPAAGAADEVVAETEGLRNALSTEDWLKVAKETLIAEGVEAVKIDRLAKACGVTRGGFYWRFKSRADLLDQLLKDWRASNTTPFLAAISGPGTPAERYRALIRLWIDEKDFNPDYDTAVRNWALTSRKVADVVHTVDDIRMDALRRLFLDAGYEENEALVRARITYFHQIGYYALGMNEATPTRAGLVDIYYRILTGFETPADKKLRAARRSKD